MNFSVNVKNDGQPSTLTPEQRQAIMDGLPARFLGADRLIRAAESGRNFSPEIRASLPKAMFILVPVFALITRLLWHRRFRRYPSHLYFALHLHAAWFLAVGTVTIIAIPLPETVIRALGAAMVIYIVGYTLVALRRVFGNRWPATIVKSIVLGAMYAVCLFSVAFGLLVYAILKS